MTAGQKNRRCALITGFSGFVGRHLASYLCSQGYRVIGTAYGPADAGRVVGHATVAGAEVREVNLLDRAALEQVIEYAQPSHIYHLAAQSHVPTSRQDPLGTWQVNVLGTLNLLEAVRRLKMDCRILSVCTSDAYGIASPRELRRREACPLRPRNPYASSKVAQEVLCRQYALDPGLDVVIVRPFSHTGPGQAQHFVCSSIARQLAEISLGLRPAEIRVGNLAPRRDFTDVRDMVRAYHLALLRGERGETYNIASGRARSIGQIVRLLAKLSGRRVNIVQDPELFRPTEQAVVRGDATHFRHATGWQPEIPFEETLSDLLDFWRQELSPHPNQPVQG